MKPFRGIGWACAVVLVAAEAGPVQAAWDNVFQVTCFRRNRPATSFYAPNPCCEPCPCPQPICTTRYVQRCYYQPVTTYQTRTYYEPVTTYRTSYYWEPVTSYRYSCYFDPCTCSYKQVACPTTSYRLRSQCCPVTSYLQRCCSVPVTTYQQVSYYEPVTTCVNPCPPPCPPPCNGQPGVQEQRIPPQPNIGESRDSGQTSNHPADRQFGTLQNPAPRSDGRSLRQPPASPQPAAPPPAVKLDRIVALPDTKIEGQVVRTDNRPHAGAQLVFINASRQDNQQSATADADGQFRVTLASGGWLVYVQGADGKPVFDRKIEVGETSQRFRLTSR